jgi:hypothetical protein
MQRCSFNRPVFHGARGISLWRYGAGIPVCLLRKLFSMDLEQTLLSSKVLVEPVTHLPGLLQIGTSTIRREKASFHRERRGGGSQDLCVH